MKDLTPRGTTEFYIPTPHNKHAYSYVTSAPDAARETTADTNG
jgi:hypothetical protein